MTKETKIFYLNFDFFDKSLKTQEPMKYNTLNYWVDT